jgi:hypothetical protein
MSEDNGVVDSRIVLSEQIDNTERRFGSNEIYYPAFMSKTEDREGGVALLFTENELRIAAERAEKNPEDIKQLVEAGAEGFGTRLMNLFG